MKVKISIYRIGFLLVFLTMMCFTPVFSQQRVGDARLGTGATLGLMKYFGDVSNEKGQKDLSKIKFGKGLYVEYRPMKMLGLSSNIILGKLNGIDNRVSTNRHLNFESNIFYVDINTTFNFDDIIYDGASALINPYFGVGFGFFTFNPMGNLTGKDFDVVTNEPIDIVYSYLPGEKFPYYVYGGDTVRNVTVDKEYETTLDSTNRFRHSAFSIPISLGVQFVPTDKIKIQLQTMFVLSFTEDLDAFPVKGDDRYGKTNDAFAMISCTVIYNIVGSAGGGKRRFKINKSKRRR